MLAELGHVLRHAPATLALKRKLPQDELYAELIGRADAAGLADRREEIVEGLRGHVVEIGCGTGAMFPFYKAPIEKVTGIEPDSAFADHARHAATSASVPVEVVEASGEHIPLPDASVDAVVLALVLCSVPSVEAVCKEIVRIVKPGGEVRLIEHVRSDKKIAGVLMRAVNPLWLVVNGQGCRLDRDPLPTLKKVGLQIDRVEPFQVWSAGLPAFPMRAIFAHR